MNNFNLLYNYTKICSNFKASSFYCGASEDVPEGRKYVRPYKYWSIDIALVDTGWLVIPKLIQM
jgi:hypothetical protein